MTVACQFGRRVEILLVDDNPGDVRLPNRASDGRISESILITLKP